MRVTERMPGRRWTVAALMGMACSGGLASIEIERQGRAEIPKGTVVEDLLGEVGLEDLMKMDLTTASELENQGVEDGDLRHVHLQGFTLAVEAPDDQDLSFLDEVEIYVEAPGLERRRVAAQSDFPEGARSVALELAEIDVVDYVVSESMTLTSEVSGRRPAQATTLLATVRFDVVVTAQGACRAIGR